MRKGNCCANTLQVIGVPNLPIPDSRRLPTLFWQMRAPLPIRTIRVYPPAQTQCALVELPLGNAHSDALVRRAITLCGEATTAMGLIPPDFAFIPSGFPLTDLHAATARERHTRTRLESSQPARCHRCHALSCIDESYRLRPARSAPRRKRIAPLSARRRIFLPRNLETRMQQRGLPTSTATFHLADSFAAHTNTTPYGFVAALPLNRCRRISASP